ncbi:hypothetical protein cand_023240 [Cryptosporidium andersoni]|uniref:Uncharacterized protein n=1 Tax=Cryptosporidium andersoni TaxID=117008 RepID=A0A1J4MVR8_9CRYT|nr:hypothetical protein cand_023240 [Cryptosporidium andersoni]
MFLSALDKLKEQQRLPLKYNEQIKCIEKDPNDIEIPKSRIYSLHELLDAAALRGDKQEDPKKSKIRRATSRYISPKYNESEPSTCSTPTVGLIRICRNTVVTNSSNDDNNKQILENRETKVILNTDSCKSKIASSKIKTDKCESKYYNFRNSSKSLKKAKEVLENVINEGEIGLNDKTSSEYCEGTIEDKLTRNVRSSKIKKSSIKSDYQKVKNKDQLLKKKYKDISESSFFCNMVISPDSSNRNSKSCYTLDEYNENFIISSPDKLEILYSMSTGLTPLNNKNKSASKINKKRTSKKKNRESDGNSDKNIFCNPNISDKTNSDNLNHSYSEEIDKGIISDILCNLTNYSKITKGEIIKQNNFILQLNKKLSNKNKKIESCNTNIKSGKNKNTSNLELQSVLNNILTNESLKIKQIEDKEYKHELLWALNEDAKLLSIDEKETLYQEYIVTDDYKESEDLGDIEIINE